MDEVDTVTCAILTVMHVHSPEGDTIAIGMCLKASVTTYIIQLYHCIIVSLYIKVQMIQTLHLYIYMPTHPRM